MVDASSEKLTHKLRELVREHPWMTGTAAAALLGLLFIWSCGTRPPAGRSIGASGEPKVQQSLLENILTSLEHLEDESPQTSTLLVERLNQWLLPQRKLFEDQPWTMDPLAAEAVPFKLAGHLGIIDFQPLDGVAVWECVCLNAIGQRIIEEHKQQGRTLDDLALAAELFDWTIRNVQLEDDSQGKTRQTSWDALLFGRGEAHHRSEVFMGLARQQQLDVVMLAYIDPDTDQLKPWLPALWHGQQFYLFEPALGLPIPGPGGKGIATLEDIVADDSLLRQLELGTRYTYPRKSADLQKVGVLIHAPPHFLARRFRILQAHLAGRKKVVVSFNPTELANSVSSSPRVKRVKIWEFPYTCLENRLPPEPPASDMELEDYQAWLREYTSGQLMFNLGAMHVSSLHKFDITPPDIKKFVFNEKEDQPKTEEERRKEEAAKVVRKPVSATLWKGRMMQFKGGVAHPEQVVAAEFAADRNAAFYYQLSRFVPDQMAEVTRQMSEKAAEFEQQAAAAQTQDASPESEQKAASLRASAEALRQQLRAYAMRNEYAAYWLGLVAYERGDLDYAAKYFQVHTIQRFPDSPLVRGAWYNLGRTLEAAGKLNEAIEAYEKDTSIQRHGNLLRAEQLRKRLTSGTQAPQSYSRP